MDAIQDGIDPQIPFPDTGSTREDLRGQIATVIEVLATDTGQTYLGLIAESQHDPTLAQALSARYIAGRRAAARAVIERGIARGELRSDLDPETTIDALWGAVYYRRLVSHAPTTSDYADTLLAQLYPALAARPPP